MKYFGMLMKFIDLSIFGLSREDWCSLWKYLVYMTAAAGCFFCVKNSVDSG